MVTGNRKWRPANTAVFWQYQAVGVRGAPKAGEKE